jgi:hypothetical protein
MQGYLLCWSLLTILIPIPLSLANEVKRLSPQSNHSTKATKAYTSTEPCDTQRLGKPRGNDL